MRLIPKKHTVPLLYATEDVKNPLCHIKLFTPDSSWSWYIIEIDECNEVCFGYVVGIERELGYFSISELESIRGPLNSAVERDLHFTPTLLSEVKDLHDY